MNVSLQQLEQELRDAEAELDQVNRQLEEKPDFGLGAGNTGGFTWEMALARRERIEQRIDELQEAIARYTSGDYGVCQSCGARIDPERLEIIPTATECMDCARKVA
ncbi:MAG: TraR/DksA C4-type zinc finger protein [Caldilineales bacterium]|nr:TraR/DksA C4-type zinc finger protein [Caldilineales bacterium]